VQNERERPKCKIIGVLEVLQSDKGKKGVRNDRLIAVPRDVSLKLHWPIIP
jgi:hypothetical protein